jgi:hypothetical protein
MAIAIVGVIMLRLKLEKEDVQLDCTFVCLEWSALSSFCCACGEFLGSVTLGLFLIFP